MLLCLYLGNLYTLHFNYVLLLLHAASARLQNQGILAGGINPRVIFV